MKEFIAYFWGGVNGNREPDELRIAAKSKTAATKSARLHAKHHGLRFIGFKEDFQ